MLWEHIRIADPAHRHGIRDEDILHAVRNAWSYTIGTHDMRIAVGPGADGTPLEIGFVRAEGESVILHAMQARKKFL
jgi:hypothetical protein